MATTADVIIAGGGIGGLTLALELHARGIACTVLEAAPAITPLGVGLNLLPHATRALGGLGLVGPLAAVAVTTAESVFFTRHGQLVAREPAGRQAGYEWPQFSVHRADLQAVLLDAVRERLPAGTVRLDHRVKSVEQDGAGASVTAAHRDGTESRHAGQVVVGADGVHSAIRGALHPGNVEPRYTGVMMWRGTTVAPPFLSGASMVRAGWLAHGKMVIYPIRNAVNAAGDQLVNWVAEVESPQLAPRDWTRAGRLEDFIGHFADWSFDWLDVPALIRASPEVLEYPMVDADPLPWWGRGRVTLLGDAAHPMVPRGSNGAAQSILDAGCLAARLAELPAVEALTAYETERRPATERVVLANRLNPPDALLRLVYERTGDRPFADIADVLTPAEIYAVTGGYAKIAGYDRETLADSRPPAG